MLATIGICLWLAHNRLYMFVTYQLSDYGRKILVVIIMSKENWQSSLTRRGIGRFLFKDQISDKTAIFYTTIALNYCYPAKFETSYMISTKYLGDCCYMFQLITIYCSNIYHFVFM